jgi:hypothetical protein
MRRDDVFEKAYLSNDLEVDVLHCTSLGFFVNFVAHVADVFLVCCDVVLGGKITFPAQSILLKRPIVIAMKNASFFLFWRLISIYRGWV